MKLNFGLVLLAGLFSLNASASLNPPGYVKASFCGEAREVEIRLGGFTMNKICSSNIVGHLGQFVTVQEVRATRSGMKEQKTVWEVTREQAAPGGVVWTVIERGYIESGMFKENANLGISSGRILVKKSASGYPETMSGELAGRRFKAANFQGVVHKL